MAYTTIAAIGGSTYALDAGKSVRFEAMSGTSCRVIVPRQDVDTVITSGNSTTCGPYGVRVDIGLTLSSGTVRAHDSLSDQSSGSGDGNGALLSSVWRRKRCALTIFGDSLTLSDWGTPIEAQSSSVRMAKNAGVGGNTSAQMLARLDADVPANTDLCGWFEQINDVSSGVTAAAHRTNVRAIAQRLMDRGIAQFMLIGPPVSTDAYLDGLYRNRAIDQLVAETMGIVCLAPFQHMIDQTNGRFLSGYSLDGTHIYQDKYWLVASNIIAGLDGALADWRPVANVRQPTINANNLLLTDTNADNVPDGIYIIGGQTVAEAQSPISGGRGNWLNVLMGQQSEINMGVYTSGFTAGDKLRVVFRIMSEWITGSPYIQIETATAPSGAGPWVYTSVGPYYQYSSPLQERIIQTDVTLPGGTTHFRVRVRTDGAGTQQRVRVGEVAVYNLTYLAP